ncbi:MAG: DMT family transporter [Mesorhizobium sp.]
MSTSVCIERNAAMGGLVTVAAVGITILAWASAFPAIRAGLHGFGPGELGALRFVIAAVPAAIYLLIVRPALPSRAEMWRFLYGGVFFVGGYTVLLNMGEMTVSAGAASFIINVSPIITAAMAMVLLGERFPALAWVGTFVSFGGIGLIALGEGGGMSIDRGALLILGGALCAATSTIVQKPLFKNHQPLTIAAWNMILGAAVLSPFLPNAIAEAQVASSQALGAALYLGFIPSLVAYASWAVALSRLPASRASNYLYCIPPVSTALGFAWLGEVPTTLGIIGGVMAMGGVAIANLSRAKA